MKFVYLKYVFLANFLIQSKQSGSHDTPPRVNFKILSIDLQNSVLTQQLVFAAIPQSINLQHQKEAFIIGAFLNNGVPTVEEKEIRQFVQMFETINHTEYKLEISKFFPGIIFFILRHDKYKIPLTFSEFECFSDPSKTSNCLGETEAISSTLTIDNSLNISLTVVNLSNRPMGKRARSQFFKNMNSRIPIKENIHYAYLFGNFNSRLILVPSFSDTKRGSPSIRKSMLENKFSEKESSKKNAEQWLETWKSLKSESRTLTSEFWSEYCSVFDYGDVVSVILKGELAGSKYKELPKTFPPNHVTSSFSDNPQESVDRPPAHLYRILHFTSSSSSSPSSSSSQSYTYVEHSNYNYLRLYSETTTLTPTEVDPDDFLKTSENTPVDLTQSEHVLDPPSVPAFEVQPFSGVNNPIEPSYETNDVEADSSQPPEKKRKVADYDDIKDVLSIPEFKNDIVEITVSVNIEKFKEGEQVLKKIESSGQKESKFCFKLKFSEKKMQEYLKKMPDGEGYLDWEISDLNSSRSLTRGVPFNKESKELIFEIDSENIGLFFQTKSSTIALSIKVRKTSATVVTSETKETEFFFEGRVNLLVTLDFFEADYQEIMANLYSQESDSYIGDLLLVREEIDQNPDLEGD